MKRNPKARKPPNDFDSFIVRLEDKDGSLIDSWKSMKGMFFLESGRPDREFIKLVIDRATRETGTREVSHNITGTGLYVKADYLK